MRIVSLEPFVTDILNYCGGGDSLVGVTHLCTAADNGEPLVLTTSRAAAEKYLDPDEACLAAGLCRFPLQLESLKKRAPEIIFSEIVAADVAAYILWAQDLLKRTTSKQVSIRNISCVSLQQMYELVENVAGVVGSAREGRELASRAKAQLMEWGDSFFDRCKGKRVVVISNLNPLCVATRWIPDLIRTMSATSFQRSLDRQKADSQKAPVEWNELVDFRPDVIVVASMDGELADSVKLLPQLQSMEGWEDIPAVKRGEVIFANGSTLYRAGPRFTAGAAVLVSAIAGLDSGYITQRDEYYKIRYIELHRHRFSL